ncbi:Alpha/Beta hydrolase protein [Mycena alexandri]|uniref:Alpha/Beta hydrolase protein n=1 Tax=Mycena alexandri TaxID=1745969 RepID=A0AAD6TKS8_9AGAR|nr:Alpha/Beta hydrolase protein [Mycena alexandri]
MPFVDLHSADDFASIHYITNSFFGNVGGFDPEKPTVCILHPTFLDSSWLYAQFNDPRLDGEFNLIAFDMRVSGKSEARYSGKHDSWVDAADLAFCHQALRLSPFHILAMESVAISCALRFATLFPEMCLSLALCNVPAPTECVISIRPFILHLFVTARRALLTRLHCRLKWIYTAYDELVQTWCFAEDLESYEHVAMEAVTFTFGSDTPLDLRDDLIAYWETTMNPRRRQRVLEQANLVMNRTPLPTEAYPHITQPILIIHGDANEACPRKYAERMAHELKAVLYTVKGGGGYLSIPPGTASIVNQVYAKFVSRLPHTRSDPAVPSISTEERMREALALLESLTSTPGLHARDPRSSLSFCCLPDDIIQSQSEGLTAYRKGQTLAYLPLGPTGKPIRRYSERPRDDWFETQTERISYAGGRFFSEPAAQRKDRHLPLPQSEPMSPADNRLRRGTFTPSSVEKLVIKGSMAKVVTGSQPTLHKLFL